MAEDEQKQQSIWKHPVVAALITFVVMAGAALLVFYWTQKEPVLTYEVFPVTSFTSEESALAIQTVRIENSGNLEAEDVQFQVTLPDGAEAVEASVDLSSTVIDFEMVSDTTSGLIRYLFPMLNPGESVRFSFLVSDSEIGITDVALRARGVVGVERDISSKVGSMLIIFFIGVVVGSGMCVLMTARLLGKHSEWLDSRLESIQNRLEVVQQVQLSAERDLSSLQGQLEVYEDKTKSSHHQTREQGDHSASAP